MARRGKFGVSAADVMDDNKEIMENLATPEKEEEIKQVEVLKKDSYTNSSESSITVNNSPAIKQTEKPVKEKRSVGRPKLSEIEKERLTIYVEPGLREKIIAYSKFHGGISEYLTKLILKDFENNEKMYKTLINNLS